MSRQEDFIQAGIDYRMEHGKPMCIAGSNLADVERDLNRALPFEAGAEHGYQYAVDKIFKCIEDQAIFGWIEDIEVDKFLEKIRKAMEE